MYIYTVIGAGGFGLGMVFFPDTVQSTFNIPEGDTIICGAYGSVLTTFGILSCFGLRSPLKFIPVLMMQLVYKLLWFVAIILPLLIKNQFPGHAFLLVLIFTTYIIGDLIAIPFSYVFSRQA